MCWKNTSDILVYPYDIVKTEGKQNLVVNRNNLSSSKENMNSSDT